MRIFLFPAIAAFAAVSCARAAPANDGDWLKREIARAKSGAVIEIPAGDYDQIGRASCRERV